MLARFVLIGAAAATVATLLTRRPSLIAEQRPLLGAIVALVGYAEFAALAGEPTSTTWSILAAAGIGACSGWFIAVAGRIGDEVFRSGPADTPTAHVSDPADRRLWYALLPLFAGAVIVRAVQFLAALMSR